MDREELIAKHHAYGLRAGVELNDATMKDFIESKIDDAVDAVDEGTAKIEELHSEKNKEVEDKNVTLSNAQKVVEVAHLRLEAESKERGLEALFAEMDPIFLVVPPTSKEAKLADVFLEELNVKLAEYHNAWGEVKQRIEREEDLVPIVRREEVI